MGDLAQLEAGSPPDMNALVAELSALAKAARQESGRTIDQVAALAHLDRTAVVRLGNGAWVREGLSRESLQKLFEAMDARDEDKGRALALYDEIDAGRKPHRSGRPADDAQRQRLVRWCCLPSQPPRRPYASIDRITLDREPDGRVTGVIERLEPESRRGAMWCCVGQMTNRSLHLTFWPASTVSDERPQSDSSGHISVQRQPSRTLAWPGYLTKLERVEGKHPRLNEFKLWLSAPNDPTLIQAASSVAVLDFDNTLADGWILGPWLDVLARAGVGEAADGAQRLASLIAHYARSESFGHDRLAHEAAEIYARSVRGVEVARLTHLAPPFVADYVSDRRGRLFASTRSLLDGLRARGHRPVLVSGAPQEVVERLMRELGITSSFPLLLRTRNGRFTGEVEFNHGLSVGKESACCELLDRDCTIAVALGDSEGDRPMWRRAACSIRVGHGDDQDVDLSGVDLQQPLDDELWSRIPSATWTSHLEA